MSSDYIVSITIRIVCFAISFWALDALDFQRFLKKGRVAKVQVLYWILAASLGWMLAEFILGLMSFA